MQAIQSSLEFAKRRPLDREFIVELGQTLRPTALASLVADVHRHRLGEASCERAETPCAVGGEPHDVTVDRNRGQHLVDPRRGQVAGGDRHEQVGQRRAARPAARPQLGVQCAARVVVRADPGIEQTCRGQRRLESGPLALTDGRGEVDADVERRSCGGLRSIGPCRIGRRPGIGFVHHPFAFRGQVVDPRSLSSDLVVGSLAGAVQHAVRIRQQPIEAHRQRDRRIGVEISALIGVHLSGVVSERLALVVEQDGGTCRVEPVGRLRSPVEQEVCLGSPHPPAEREIGPRHGDLLVGRAPFDLGLGDRGTGLVPDRRTTSRLGGRLVAAESGGGDDVDLGAALGDQRCRPIRIEGLRANRGPLDSDRTHRCDPPLQ